MSEPHVAERLNSGSDRHGSHGSLGAVRAEAALPCGRVRGGPDHPRSGGATGPVRPLALVERPRRVRGRPQHRGAGSRGAIIYSVILDTRRYRNIT